MNINLANIDFIPGQGGGGGITPSTPEVEPLYNKSEGYLNMFQVSLILGG